MLPAALEELADDPTTRAFLDGMSTAVGSLFDAARALSDSLTQDDPLTDAALDLSLDAAEDRVALVSRPIPARSLSCSAIVTGRESARPRTLLAFVFSDEHLRLRAAWSYIPEEGGERHERRQPRSPRRPGPTPSRPHSPIDRPSCGDSRPARTGALDAARREAGTRDTGAVWQPSSRQRRRPRPRLQGDRRRARRRASLRGREDS